MINSIHPDPHEWQPQPKEWELDWSCLVRMKQDFIAFAKTYFRTTDDKNGARIDIVLMEQTIEDRIEPQVGRLLEFFNDDRTLPFSDFYREFLGRK